MNKSVPTLLGVMIILMVVVLVVLMYDFRLTTKLAAGEIPVGTVGGQALTGAEPPDEQISPHEALAARTGEKQTLSAADMQRRQKKMEAAGDGKQGRGARAGVARAGAQGHREGRAPGSGEQKPGTD